MAYEVAAGGDAGAAVFGVDETGDGGVLDHAEREARGVDDAVRPVAGALVRDKGVRIAARGAAQELDPGSGDAPPVGAPRLAEMPGVAQGISGGSTPSPGGVAPGGKMGSTGDEMGGTR